MILKKLEYFREGKSEKHLQDIAGILKISGAEIDRAYIEAWADRLVVREIWDRIVSVSHDKQRL